MTVETTSGGEPIVRSGPYNGDGVTASFDYDFQIQDEVELKVTRQNADGTETVLTLTTDYTVSGVGNDAGGSITLVDAATDAPSGSKLVIQYDGLYTQSVDYSNQGRIQLSLLENSLDKLMMHCRSLKEIADRAVTVDAFSTADITVLRANINALAGIESAISTVAANIGSVNTVSGDIANVNTVAGVASGVSTLAPIAANITTVAGIAANVTTCATNIANIVTVAGISTDVTAVAAVSADVTTCADNIAAILAAPTEASDAAASASAAATSETNAAASASAAATSETNAASSASAAAASAASVTPADAADYRAKIADRLLSPVGVWDSAAEVTLTDGANIALDLNSGINFGVTLAGNRTLDNPTNAKVGQTGFIKVTQDATGSRTLAFDTNYKFKGGTAPTLTTDANAVDLLFYQVISSTFILVVLVGDVS